MIAPSASRRRAFTLIELLVVIAIIAILITLLFPAADAAFEQARRAHAKNDATQIATAITGYMSEYGKLPATGAGDVNDDTLMKTLAGINVNELNPREVVFLEVPRAKKLKNGAVDDGSGSYSSGYYDSWGKLYTIKVDNEGGSNSYDNKITGPDGVVRKSVIVWSQGNPGRASYTDSTKWIKSWE